MGTDRPRTRLEPAVRRDQILAAAESVFAEQDPADVTFEQVADAAGVSRALVYNYFGDRGGLLAALYLRSFTDLDARLEEAFAGSAHPSDRLREVVRAYVAFARQDADRSTLIWNAEAGRHPAVLEARRRRYDRMTARWGGTTESRILARGVIGLLESAVDEWISLGATDDSSTTEVLHRLLWAGISSFGAGALDGHTAAPHLPASA